ncbi:hypothetical protein TrRE_jg6154 [Triparma retinervis]|uniref:Uncharacterized protein n=1 Tax=Triparma retinervis TaxID=2557542 RepID=A0A9W7A7V9_9STRA|nr:hypothetical protein TrRE_jg6154 [Triparma retinervis]
MILLCGAVWGHIGEQHKNHNQLINKSWRGGGDHGGGGRGRRGFNSLLTTLDGVLFGVEEEAWVEDGGEGGVENGATTCSSKTRKSGGKRKGRRKNRGSSSRKGRSSRRRSSTGSSSIGSEEDDAGEEEESNALIPPGPSEKHTTRGRLGRTKRVLKQRWQRILFFATSIDALHAIFTNRSAKRDRTGQGKGGGIVGSIMSPLGIRFFPPRLLFLIGAFARAIQMSTPLNRVFNPTLGVAGMVNAGALWIQARWLPRIVFGWIASKRLWDIVGAKPPVV